MLMRSLLVAFLLAALVFACTKSPTGSPDDTAVDSELSTIYDNPAIPEWSKTSNIYEVNIRQYTPEGTFSAFAEHLPRLQKMGVDILWFMPIYPISETKRKGSLGSYYAISDYTAVNPNFGTPEEFQAVVDEAQELGMHVILDWVPNHTGWDHEWIEEHPDYYTQDEEGNIIDPINPETGESWGWTDVADLNYDNENMRADMISAMRFWLDEVGVDGFRVDVAHNVPTDFWEEAVPQLRASRSDLFLLAEAEYPPLNNKELFAMSYGWSFHHLMNQMAKGEASVADLRVWREQEAPKWEKGWLMNFITNHDENSWNGTIEERLGDAADAMAVLTFTFEGMPLIYSGQEAAMDKRLKFFEKDLIEWGDIPKQDFYTKLLQLKTGHPALWNGTAGAPVVEIETNLPEDVFAFQRTQEDRAVMVVLNLSDNAHEVTLAVDDQAGSYTELFSGAQVDVPSRWTISLDPWEYRVLNN